MRWIVFAAMVACHTSAIPPEPPDARPDEAAKVAAPVPADVLGDRLQAVSERIEAELLAEARVPEIDRHGNPVWPEPDDADDAPPKPRWLRALGPCERPDAATITTMTQRIERWIVGKKIRYSELRVAWGCVEPPAKGAARHREPGGVIASFGVVGHTGADPEAQSSYDWIARVSSRKIDVLFSVQGGNPEGGEWTPQASLEAHVLYPVGDHHDVIALRQEHISGETTADYTFELRAGGRPVGFAHHRGLARAAAWQPSPEAHVVELTDEETGAATFRCIGPREPLTRCPAALALERWRRRVLALDAMSGVRDHDTLATYLGLAEVPVAERAGLLALARPSTLLERIEDFTRERTRRDAELTEAEDIAQYRAETAALATRLRAVIGAHACTMPTVRDELALHAATKRWLGGKHPPADPAAEYNEFTDCPLGLAKLEDLDIGPVCSSGTHFTWVAHWRGPSELYGSCTHAAIFNAHDLDEVRVAKHDAIVPIPAAGTSPARYEHVPMYVSDGRIVADVDNEQIVIQHEVVVETTHDMRLFANTVLREVSGGKVRFKRLDPDTTELLSFAAPADLPGSLAVVREPWPFEGSAELAAIVMPIERKAFFDDYLTSHCLSAPLDEAACAVAFDEVRRQR